MTLHLQKMRVDIDRIIPNRDYTGLAIIDFEEWHPIWGANFGIRKIYQHRSIAHVRQRAPGTSYAQAKSIARNEFNAATR